MTVDLQYAPLKDDYLSYKIEVMTSIGNYIVTAMVVSEAYDMGLYNPGSPYVELTFSQPEIDVYVVNGNYGTHTPIVITAIYDFGPNPFGTILDLIHQDLPYTLEAGETFTIYISPIALVDKGETWPTTLIVESDGGNVEFSVSVDSDLISITEISSATKLYPNPTSGQFTVVGTDIAKVEVYNLVGQKVWEDESGTAKGERYIDATNWNKGIYLVNITNQNGAIETKKLVLK